MRYPFPLIGLRYHYVQCSCPGAHRFPLHLLPALTAQLLNIHLREGRCSVVARSWRASVLKSLPGTMPPTSHGLPRSSGILCSSVVASHPPHVTFRPPSQDSSLRIIHRPSLLNSTDPAKPDSRHPCMYSFNFLHFLKPPALVHH